MIRYPLEEEITLDSDTFKTYIQITMHAMNMPSELIDLYLSLARSLSVVKYHNSDYLEDITRFILEHTDHLKQTIQHNTHLQSEAALILNTSSLAIWAGRPVNTTPKALMEKALRDILNSL